MKSWFFRSLLLTFLTVAIQSCGGEDPDPSVKTAEEIATEALTGTGSQAWGVDGGGSVERDGVTVTDIYMGYELVLKSGPSKTYTSKNSNDLFDASGTWTFEGSNFDKFMLSGSKPAAGKEVSFTQTNNKLKLAFTIPAPGARVNGVLAVAGSYTFNLIKQ